MVTAAYSLLAADALALDKTRFSVADGIEMVVIDNVPWTGWGRSAPYPSPDGRKALIVTRQGRIAEGVDRYELHLYEPSNRSGPVTHRVIASFATEANDRGIASVQWIDDEYVAILGTKDAAPSQIYFVSAKTGAIEQVTHYELGVRTFSVNRRGDLVFLSQPEPDAQLLRSAIQTGFVVEVQNPYLLIGEDWPQALPTVHNRVFFVERGKPAKEIKSLKLSIAGAMYPQLWLSPNGKFVLVRDFTGEIPPNWLAYSEPVLKQRLPQILESKRKGIFSHVDGIHALFLCNIEHDTYEPLTGTPADIFSSGMWMPDGQSIIVTHLMLPLGDLSGELRETAMSQPAVSEVSLASRKVLPVLFMEDREVLGSLAWDPRRERLKVGFHGRTDVGKRVREFRRSGGQWREDLAAARTETADSAALFDGMITASVVEDLNTPAEVHFLNRAGGKVIYQSDFNPKVRDMDLGTVRHYAWEDEDGDRWQGGVLYPPGYRPGTQYPLIIQTHGFDPNVFLRDGINMAPGQAARALAARGFVVVQEPVRNNNVRYSTPHEGPKFVKSYRALIGQLTREGVVDPAKVGIIGWSRTDYHVKYLITHGALPIAAASANDGVDLGYIGGIFSSHFARSFGTWQGVYGPIPGKGLDNLFRDAPTFNVHKMKTPLLISTIGNGNGSIAPAFEMYSWLKLYGIPTELMIYPRGVHALQKVGERYRSQQANVDWFSFWILGHEDPAPEKAKQYQRWRAMRERQCERLDGEHAPAFVPAELRRDKPWYCKAAGSSAASR